MLKLELNREEIETLEKQIGSPFFSADAKKYISNDWLNRTSRNGTGSLRLAAYIRVSTENKNQEDSYETQVQYFTKLLTGHPDWIFAGIYSDFGLTATSSENRTGFQRILRHCREGKIDRILCKSISRFARNTSDFIKALQVLRESQVTILFEKENLDTAKPTSAFILTALGAIAQEESRTISENIRWSINKRYPSGEVRNIPIYGYRYIDGKNAFESKESGYRLRQIEIVEEEAQIVQRIFREAAEGQTYVSIARKLNYEKIPAPPSRDIAKQNKYKSVKEKKGKLKMEIDQGWTPGKIGRMLKLERYTGDVLLQKTYTADYLNHAAKKNTGELPMYLAQNHHPAMISRELFQQVQKIREWNAAKWKERIKGTRHPFSGLLVCAHCGRFYNTRNRSHHPIWYCPSTVLHNGKEICKSERIYEEQIVRMFRKAVLVRFGVISTPFPGEALLADILNGCHTGKLYGWEFAKAEKTFVSQLCLRLETIQQTDFVEWERSFLKRRIQILGTEQKKLAGCNPADCEKRKILSGEERLLKDKLIEKEAYWEELETGYLGREKAIQWMKDLSSQKKGIIAFLNGLTDAYVKAFVLSIIVNSPFSYRIHWFDDVWTEIGMESNIKDHRCHAAFNIEGTPIIRERRHAR